MSIFFLWELKLLSFMFSKTRKKESTTLHPFKSGERDVLIATDVTSKGLDFPDVNHVVNMICLLKLRIIFIVLSNGVVW